MTISKRLLSILLSVCILVCLSPSPTANSSIFTDVNSAAKYIRSKMVARESSITLVIKEKASNIGELTNDNFKKYYKSLSTKLDSIVFNNTGKGDEGDYLKNHLSSHFYKFKCNHANNAISVSIDIKADVSYRTSFSQEQKVTSAISKALKSLKISTKSDYEKIVSITDYICEKVEYDNKHVNDDSYELMHSAYAAIIDGAAVCQGYANLFYRMAVESGLDSRIITGVAYNGEATKEHAWNIVKINGTFYYIDPTWIDVTGKNSYFLNGKTTFEKDHFANSEFDISMVSMDDYVPFGNDSNINKDVSYKNTKVPVKFLSDWFRPESAKYIKNTTYNQDLAAFCSDFALIGYDRYDRVDASLNSCGFKVLSDLSVTMQTRLEKEKVNTFIAAKTIIINDKTKKHLVFVGTIGSAGLQWYSNFDPFKGNKDSNAKTNLGFLDASNYAYDQLKDILNKEEYGFTKDNTILLLTGHSRGAAAANLLAKRIIDEGKWVQKDSIYTYTFATPNVTAEKDVNNNKYNTIFNIVNPEDFVTKVMLKGWGYSKYGTTYVLPSKTNTISPVYNIQKSNMREYYSVLTNGKNYSPYLRGEAATHNIINLMFKQVPTVKDLYTKKLPYNGSRKETPYLFFRNAMLPILAEKDETLILAGASEVFSIVLDYENKNELFRKLLFYFLDLDIGINISSPLLNDKINHAITSEGIDFLVAHHAETYCAYMNSLYDFEVKMPKISFIGAVNCPVDIEIIDKNTNEIVGRIIDNTVDEDIFAGDNSVVLTVNGDEKVFWLPSDGNYEVKLIGNDEGVMDYTLIKNDSNEGELERVNFFDVPITKENKYSFDIHGETFELAAHKLISDDNKIIEPTETMINGDFTLYNVKLTIDGPGFVSGDSQYISGDYAVISAFPDEDNVFKGWYNNEELISAEQEYRFRVDCDTALTAKFEKEHKEHTWDAGAVLTPSTCATKGAILFTCTVCKETKTESISVDPTNHADYDIELQNVKEPTETEVGYTGDKVCSVCGAIISKGEKIPVLMHKHTLIKTDAKDATCTDMGNIEYYTCSDCGKLFYDAKDTKEASNVTVKASGHKLVKTAEIAPTCTSSGNVEYFTCSVCGMVFSDAKGMNETSDVTVNATGHKLVKTDSKAATCTESGNIEYYTCSICNKTFSDSDCLNEIKNIITKAEGHVLKKTASTAPTCTTTGNVEYYSCSVCGKTFLDENGTEEITDVTIKTVDHIFEEWTLKKNATITENGIEIRKCSVCGFEEVRDIEKLEKRIPGDIDGNGVVLADDARIALRSSAKLEILNDDQLLAADVDGNGLVLADDARQILRFSAKLQDRFKKS